MTKEELKYYLAAKEELMDLRRKVSAAQERARHSKTDADAERACREVALYETTADLVEQQRLQIEAAIMAVRNPDARRALRMRYIDGRSDVEIAMRLNYSDRQIRRIINTAIEEIERAGD